MGELRAITNIQILGQTYYYDECNNTVGFPSWYKEDLNQLDYRVGHQIWIPKDQAQAIIRRVLEQEWAKNSED